MLRAVGGQAHDSIYNMSRWRRILYVSFVAQIFSLIGFSFVYPFLPLFIQTLGVHGSAVPLWSGVISFSTSIPMALVSPVWGALADRYGRKPMVVRAMASGVLTTGLLIVAPNVWFVLVLRMVQGILTGSVAASQALVASVTPREEMSFSMGLMQSAVFSGGAVGPLVGGLLDDHLGFRGTFAVGAGMLLLAALLVLFFVDEEFERPTVAAAVSLNPLASIRGAAVSPGLLVMALVLFMAQFSNIMPAPILAIFVPHLSGVPRLHGQLQTSTVVGVILAMEGICAALASTQARRLTDRFGYRGVLIFAVALAGIVYAPAFAAQSVWHLVLVRAAEGLSLGAAMPVASAIIGLITPEKSRAAAYGLTSSASSFGFAFGPLAGGLLGAAFGLRAVFLITAVMLLIVAGVIAVTVPEPSLEEGVTAAAPAPVRIRRVIAGSRGRK